MNSTNLTASTPLVFRNGLTVIVKHEPTVKPTADQLYILAELAQQKYVARYDYDWKEVENEESIFEAENFEFEFVDCHYEDGFELVLNEENNTAKAHTLRMLGEVKHQLDRMAQGKGITAYWDGGYFESDFDGIFESIEEDRGITISEELREEILVDYVNGDNYDCNSSQDYDDIKDEIEIILDVKLEELEA